MNKSGSGSPPGADAAGVEAAHPNPSRPWKYGAGLEFAISRGWPELHESGTFVQLSQSGADCSPDTVRVPELTCATNIKLNMRVSLRRI